MNPHETLIRRAITLAQQGRGRVEPNPMVGCVLVRDGRVIGEGYHPYVGGPHAEPTALADCAARGNEARGATAYVTLEPCCHTNKRTPPCVPTLLRAGVTRVVLGCPDPNPDVDGKGVAQLRAAGVEVITGVLEAECRQLLAPFTALTSHGRPYVTLKWAQTADGKLAGPRGVRTQISSIESSRLVHRLRARCGAILVGGSTLRTDDPLLTARTEGAPSPDAASEDADGLRAGASSTPHAQGNTLLRCVITSRASLPRASRLLGSPEAGPVVVYTTSPEPERIDRPNVTLVRVGGVADMLSDLGRRGVAHLLVESGAGLARTLIDAHLADRAWVFTSPDALPGGEPRAVELHGWATTAQRRVGRDTLEERLDPRSAVSFAPEASADVLQLVG